MSAQRKVQVWIYRVRGAGHEVLLLKTQPKRGAFWQPVTGSVEEGEADVDAALREAQEETGLAFASRPESLNHAFEFDGRWGRARETCYALAAPPTGEARTDPKEHQAHEWVDSAAAAARLKFDSNRVALGLLLERLGKNAKN